LQHIEKFLAEFTHDCKAEVDSVKAAFVKVRNEFSELKKALMDNEAEINDSDDGTGSEPPPMT
jgi:cell division protein FtsB